MVLRIIYTILIGSFLAIFYGVGIATFYVEPTPPEYPASLQVPKAQNLDQQVFLQLVKEQERYDALLKAYQQAEQIYNRNVSVISIILAIITLVTSLFLADRIQFLADGLLLGGLLTLIYSVFRGFGTESNIFKFCVVSIGLAIALILGYLKLVRGKQLDN